MSNELRSKIVKFAKNLPHWQKILAKLAFDTKRPANKQEPEVEIALKRFMYDNELSDELIGQEILDEIDALDFKCSENNGLTPRLIKVERCKHINAIASDQVITFAPKLTIIYGENGTGKSGYARFLSSAFFSRGDSVILPNIFKHQVEQGEPEGEFMFEIGDEERLFKFPSDKNESVFKHFACFDSKTVEVHLRDSNELYVMPPEMKFFDRLAQLIKIICEKLKHEALTRKKQNCFINLLQGESIIKELIKYIDHETNFEDLKKLIGSAETIKTQLEQAEKECCDLKNSNSESKLKEKREIKKQLERLKINFECLFKNYFNNTYIDKIKNAIKELLAARRNNQEVGVSSFKTELLKTSGSEIWKRFILSMMDLVREESDDLQRKFPDNNDHCPSCLQRLQPDALILFERYFDFLKGESEKKLRIADDKVSNIILEVSSIRLPSLLDSPKLHLWLESNCSDKKKDIDGAIQLLTTYKSNLKDSLSNSNMTEINKCRNIDILANLSKMVDSLNTECEQYNEKHYDEQVKEKNKLLTELQHKNIIASHLDKVKSYVENLIWSEKANAGIEKISTKLITDESKRIFDDHFNKKYTQHFHKEIQILGIDFNIDVKPKSSYGKTSRRLDLLNYSPSDILSEGQKKALALADFFTEVDICDISGGIILDDPVNSLDHERKLAIAKRLVKESKKRQVIIFTHDIAFLCDLVNEAESQELAEKKDVLYHWVSRRGSEFGFVTLNHRRNLEKDYKEAEKAQEYLKKSELETDPFDQEKLCKSGFDCLRKSYEAFILYELFAGTVVRFDRQIKYAQLKKVYCPKNYINEISKKLSYCSEFVSSHLHSDQYLGQKASPRLLKQEINDFNELKRKFRKERKEASKTITLS